jgi:hypothetical protein
MIKPSLSIHLKISGGEGAMMKTFDDVVRIIHAKGQNEKRPNGK